MNPPQMRGRSAMPRSSSQGRSKSRTRSKSREALDRLQQETVDSKTTLHASGIAPTAAKSSSKISKETDNKAKKVVPATLSTWDNDMFSSFGNFGTSVGTTVNNEIGKIGDFLFNDKAAYLSSTPPQKVTRVLDTRPAKSPRHKRISKKHKRKMDRTAGQQRKVDSKTVVEKEKLSKADDQLMDSGPELTMNLQPLTLDMNEESDYGPEPPTDLASRVSVDTSSAATVQIANTSGKEKEHAEISQDVDPAIVRPRGILGAFRRMKSFGRGRERFLDPVVEEKAELTVLEPEVIVQSVSKEVSSDITNLPRGTTQLISIDAVKEILSERCSSVHVFEPSIARHGSRVLPRQGLKSITPSNLQKWLRFAQQRISLHRQQADESPILMSTPTRSTTEGNIPVRTTSRSSSDQKLITKAPHHETVRVVSPKTQTGKDPEKKRAASAKKKTISRKHPSLSRESKMDPYLATRGNPSSLSQF